MPNPHTGEWSGIRQFGQLAADPGGQDNGAGSALDQSHQHRGRHQPWDRRGATYFGLANPSA